MNDPEKHLTPTLMKGESFEAAIWKYRNREFYVHGIRVDIKYRPPLSMQDELEYN